MGSMAELLPVNELPPIDPEADAGILPYLNEAAVPLVNRHINPQTARENPNEPLTVGRYMGENKSFWTPALVVPWTVGENFAKDYEWDPKDQPLPNAARSSLLIGLWTEDNLPWYTETIDTKFGKDGPLGFWNRVWTSEEGRHSEVMRGYMTVARLVDPVELEVGRVRQVVTAEVPNPLTVSESAVYVVFQEAATRESHLNTGKLIADTAKDDERLHALTEDGTALANVEPVEIQNLNPEQRDAYIRQVGRAIMTRVAGDENKHFAFYRDLVGKGALEVDPSTAVRAIERQIRDFQMPGVGIEGFWDYARTISEAGVYDLKIHHDRVIAPVLKHWKFESLEGLDDEAERARERTVIFMDSLNRKASRFEEERAERRAAAAADDPEAVWVGKQAA